MPIDFFDSQCIQETTSNRFGICDDPPPAQSPAYLSFNEETLWIAEVLNIEEKEVKFIAVDHCIEIRRENGDLESRCDGILTTNDLIAFVELKDRIARHKWVSDGAAQLTVTIQKFKDNNSLTSYSRCEGYIANKQKPFFNNSISTIAQKFKDETGGFIFKVKKVIEL